MPIVRIRPKGKITIPSAVRSAVGLTDGALVEMKVAGGKIVITPQRVIQPPTPIPSNSV